MHFEFKAFRYLAFEKGRNCGAELSLSTRIPKLGKQIGFLPGLSQPKAKYFFARPKYTVGIHRVPFGLHDNLSDKCVDKTFGSKKSTSLRGGRSLGAYTFHNNHFFWV